MSAAFRPYGLEPDDPKLYFYLAQHLALDLGGDPKDQARAREWYKMQKAAFEGRRRAMEQVVPPKPPPPAPRRRHGCKT